MGKFSRREVVGGAAVAGIASAASGSPVLAQADKPTSGPPPAPLAGQKQTYLACIDDVRFTPKSGH